MPPSKRSKRAVSDEDSDEVRTYPQLVSDGRMYSTSVKPDNEPQPQFHKSLTLFNAIRTAFTLHVLIQRGGFSLEEGVENNGLSHF